MVLIKFKHSVPVDRSCGEGGREVKGQGLSRWRGMVNNRRMVIVVTKASSKAYEITTYTNVGNTPRSRRACESCKNKSIGGVEKDTRWE